MLLPTTGSMVWDLKNSAPLGKLPFTAGFRCCLVLIALIRPELAWLGEESNHFGTDEFLKWCEVVGTEPYFALNFGTGRRFEIPMQRDCN